MIYKILLSVAISLTLISCGSSRDSNSSVKSSNGVVTLSGDAVVGGVLTASIADEDGVNAGTETYQWYSTAKEDPIDGATSSSYSLTADEGRESVTALVRYTDNSGTRETVSSAPMDIQAAFILEVLYMHGLVDGASCEIFAVNDSGVASNTALSTAMTVNGIAAFSGLIAVDGTALVSCTGGTYVSEATGFTINAPDTRAVVNVADDATFTVTPLTEIATQLAESEGDLNTALTFHNLTVARVFGIDGDITEIEPIDLLETAASDDDESKYATALVIIAQLDANDMDTSTAEVVATLAEDLTDGQVSETALVDLNQAIVDLGTSVVFANLNPAVTTTVEDAVNNKPEPATFAGLSASIPNDQTDALTGRITVTDVNFGEDQVTPQELVATTYGSFSIEADGSWTYTLETANETVAGLDVGDSVNDTIAITSVDGTAASFVMRVTALTKVAEITDPGGDTGEIRFNLDEPLLVGKLTFSFLKEVAVGSDGNVKDAYVTLYGNENSNKEALVDLRIQGDQFEDDDITPIAPRFFARNTDSDLYPGDIVTFPFTEDQWYEIEITWNVDSTGQEVTVIVDGETVNGGPFQTAALLGDDCGGVAGYRANCLKDGVENIQFRFGDDDRSIPFGSYFVDNIKVYNNMEGTGTPVFQDDFENSTLGTANSVYRQETTVAVALYDRATESSTDPVAAQFFDLTATIDSDRAELLTGQVTVVDLDEGEALITEQADIATTFGSFSISSDGVWEYMLDTADSTIAALMVGQVETDTIAIASIDGTTADIVIAILGQVPLPASDVKNKVAVIRDLDGDEDEFGPDGTDADDSNDGADEGDTGELRYDFATEIAADDAVTGGYLAGRVEFQITRTDDNVGDDTTGIDPAVLANKNYKLGSADAFINLFSASENDAGSIAKIRVKDDSFQLDYHSSCSGCSDVDLVDDMAAKVLPSIDAAVLSQYNTVVITWDYAASVVADSPVINVTIDGIAVLSDYTVLNAAPGGVTLLSFRFGDNDGWLDPRAKFVVDNWSFYSDTAGTNLVASDTFQSYSDGDSLDTDNIASPYASATDNAVVEETGESLP